MEERTGKGKDQKKKRVRTAKIGGRIVSGGHCRFNEMFRMIGMNCETFEEILPAIGPVITKTTDPKTIMN